MEPTIEASILQIPQEVLTAIFNFLPIAPERWRCLQVCKAFYKAVHSPLLWTHIILQNSSVIDKDEAPIWQQPWKLPQKEKAGFESCLRAPKKLQFMAASFLNFLKQRYREHVVELDLSYAKLLNREEFIVASYSSIAIEPEITLWDFIFDFPNLQNLSLFGTDIGRNANESYRYPNRMKVPAQYATSISSVRNLNLLFSNLIVGLRLEDLADILRHMPNLETLQISPDVYVENSIEPYGFTTHANLKKIFILENGCQLIDSLMPFFPNLELVILSGKEKWISKEGKATIIEPAKDLHEIQESEFTMFQQDLQKCIPTYRCQDIPIFFRMIAWYQVKAMQLPFEYLSFDLNAKVRGMTDTIFDPFVLPYALVLSWYGKTVPIEGETALHYAARLGFYDKVEFLLQHGADPNVRDRLSRTPIFYSQDTRTMELLVKYGADPTCLDQNGWNILMSYIAQKKHAHGDFAEDYENVLSFFAFDDNYEDHAFRDIEKYTDLGCDLSHRAHDGLNVFKIALASGNFFLAKYFLKITDDAMVETSPSIGCLSCVVIARNVTVTEQLDMIKYLLEKGADPMIVDDAGQSFLHHAALKFNFDDLLQALELIENSSDLLRLTDTAGYTCIHYIHPCLNWDLGDQQDAYIEAVRNTIKQHEPETSIHDNSAVLFMSAHKVAEYGCLNFQSTSGETPLLLGCKFVYDDRYDCVQKLLAHGADPNIADLDGVSPLISTAYDNNAISMKMLLDYGANVNHCDNKGISPLLAATLMFVKKIDRPKKKYSMGDCRREFDQALTLLLNMGADVNHHEKLCGFTALHLLACCKQSVEVIGTLMKKLVEHGADVNARSHINETPLHRAVLQRNTIAVKALLELGADINARGVKLMTPLHYVMNVLDKKNEPIESITKDGFKAVGNAIVRQPSWQWSSIDDLSQYSKEFSGFIDAHMVAVFNVLMLHADRIDFSAIDFEGEIPLHKTGWISRFENGDLFPVTFEMLSRASKDQLLTKNIYGITPMDNFMLSVQNDESWHDADFILHKKSVAKKCLEILGDAVTDDHLLMALQARVDISAYNTKGVQLLLCPKPTLNPHPIEPPTFEVFSKPITDIEIFKRYASIFDPSIWKHQQEDTKMTILHRFLSWWRNDDCEALLFNQVHPLMGGDRILFELLELGADPHAKNIVGISFADMVPEYEKIRANLPLLRGEEKSAIQKPNYFSPPKSSQTEQLLDLIAVPLQVNDKKL